MSAPEDRDRPATIDQTTDLPADGANESAHAGPSTARRGDTSVHSAHLQTGNRPGDQEPDDPSRTGPTPRPPDRPTSRP